MDGYSITEAASVLGVPTERVWELLARGVLAGEQEGETGMRVYLHPRPAPAPRAVDAGRPSNDPTAEPERELSPFRELLTEFRNLTERYGQALLALGESRGEVASLRSRVDLLEARIDLRLPLTSPATAAPPAPPAFPADHTVIPTAVVEPAETPAETPAGAGGQVDDEEPRGRNRGPRRATERFADALARAEDPSLPELPRAEAAAINRSEAETQFDPALPRELPAAEVVLTAEEAAVEPPAADGIADEVADRVATTAGGWTAPPEAARPAPDARSDTAPAPVEPLDWDAERYTTSIDETDWMASDAWEPEPQPEPAASDEAIASEQPAVEHEPEPPVEPGEAAEATDDEPEPEDHEPAAVSEGIEPEEIEPQEAMAEEPSEPEETMLWFGRSPDESGAAEMEVVTSAARPAEAPIELPGGDELDEALAEMAPIAIEAPETAPPPTPPTPPTSATPISSPAAAIPRTTAPPRVVTTLTRPGTTPTAMTTGPASRAYRRLRRIFPG